MCHSYSLFRSLTINDTPLVVYSNYFKRVSNKFINKFIDACSEFVCLVSEWNHYFTAVICI